MNPLQDPRKLAKIAAFVKKVESRNQLDMREQFLTSLTAPRLEHVYKDRSYKAALAMDLKVTGGGQEKHWSYDSRHRDR